MQLASEMKRQATGASSLPSWEQIDETAQSIVLIVRSRALPQIYLNKEAMGMHPIQFHQISSELPYSRHDIH